MPKGGKREGAGRPKGTGKYGCKTAAIRVPAHLVDDVRDFVAENLKAGKEAEAK